MDSVARDMTSWLEQMPDVRSDVEAARQRIGRLSRLFTAVLHAAAAEQEVSLNDLETLSVIYRNGNSVSPSQIATELHLTSGSVSTRLRRLERAQLAEADAVDPDDARMRIVRLTPLGVQVWRRGTARRTSYEADLFAALDPSTLATLNEALAVLLERFELEFGDASRHDRN